MLPEQMSLTGFALGQYQIVARIGSGGMATVYRAIQTSLNREVAVKILPSHFANDEAFVERFKQEAVAIATLRHPNILNIFDYGEQNGVIFMVMELVPGGTLADRLGQPVPFEEVLAFMTPLAGAIDYAHSRGIIHRDLKPANVLLTLAGDPILSDFGLARLLEGTRLTRSGSALGTPEYMSPEQAMAGEVGPATDVYAFGVLLYEMLTGVVPFGGETPVAIILAHLHQPPPTPRSVNPNIPERVEEVILKCLSKEPGDRYPSAIAVIRALEATRPSMSGGMMVSPGISAPRVSLVSAEPPAEQRESGAEGYEYGELRVDLGGEKLRWNGQGTERARELLLDRLKLLEKDGWQLVGSLHDRGILQQGTSLLGPTVRSAHLYLRRPRQY